MRARPRRRWRPAMLAAVTAALVAATSSPAGAWLGPSSGPRSGAPTPAATTGAESDARPWALAGQGCRLIAAPVATPGATPVAGSGTCDGVRPGAPVYTPVGQCTLNFLWRGSDGRDYIGTAGHCLLEDTNLTRAIFPPGDGPEARDGAGRVIGEFAYASLDGVSDFALIRLYPGVAASPELCQFGGPSGLNADPIPGLTALQYVGRGSLTGSVVPARTQLTLDGGDVRVLTSLGVASPGDSGSPVIGLDGRAVGVVVAIGPAISLLPPGLVVFDVRIAPEMGRASKAMGVAFDLVTAPVHNLLSG